MNTRFQQTSRMGRLSTVLGADELVLLRFFGTESINSLSEFRVEALSNTDEIDFDDLVGTHATVEIDHAEHGPQPFDGIITKARFLGAGENGFRYEFELRPWLWLTSKRRTQQIFHRMTVVEILHDLWAPYDHLGSPAFESHLTGDYPELEYTVQFCESDLDFACRMMERFGISYYFQHALGSHTLVLFDKAGALENVPGGKRPFYTARSHHSHERFTEWRAERNLTTGAIKLTDYNFKKPGARMLAQRRGNAKHAEGMIESFDWPGRYLELDQGEEFEIRLRLDQERGQDQRQFAVGNCLCLRAGLIVELSGDPVPDATGKSFICLRADHSYVSNAFGTGIEMRAEDHGYSGKYTFMPQTAPVAPRRKTSLARVEGPQTATVVGEGEIDCDEYGRILVRFHWDLDHAYSMRCRVSQNWAGNGWGGMVIPRIGMEVLVEFLDGDPDKPLVTGCVYNGRNDVPYELPEHKTRSTFKTDTHEGSGFNELRFEDKRDAEEIFVHAQRDKNTKVERNFSERVNRNVVESIGHDKASEVSNTLKQMVGGDMNLGIGPGKIGSITPSGAASNTQGLGRLSEGMGDVGSRPGSGNLVIHVEDSKNQTIDRFHHEKVRKDKSTDVGDNYRLDVGKKIEITAGDSITIKVGKSLLTMDDAGNISLNGKKTTVTMDKLFQVMADLIKLN